MGCSAPSLADAESALLREAWRRGLAWLRICDDGQIGWIERFNSGVGSFVWQHGRQRGKSFAAFALLDSYARAWPESRVRFVALTIDTARGILSNSMADYLATCPEDLRPKKDGDDWLYPNGSRLIVVGTDATTFRRARGFSRIGLQAIDECGFMQDLDEVQSALQPGLQVPGPSGETGRTLYLSTPSVSPAHPYAQIARVHRARGAFELETFQDNPRINPQSVVQREMERTGYSREELFASTAFRREYLGEWVLEESRAALPAWTAERAAAQTVAVERPAFFDGYVAIDLGYSPDPSFVLLAWHDVAGNRVVVEREAEVRSGTVADLAASAKELETQAWGASRFDGTLLAARDMLELPEFLQRKLHSTAPAQPFLRIGDNDMMVLAELAQTHGYAVVPTRKDEKALAVDFVNQLISTGRLVVNPRCVRTLEQMGSAVWNRARTGWERNSRDHSEAIDCLAYLCRNIRWNRDVRPKAPVLYFHGAPSTQDERGWNNAFGRRKRL